MKFISTPKYLKNIFVVIFSCTVTYSYAVNNNSQSSDSTKTDDFDIKNASFLLPQHLPSGKYSSAINLMSVFIPPDWALDVIKTPMLGYAGKYTLPRGFNIQAGISTLFISTRINAGPWWNYSANNYHFGVGYHVAFNYGVLNQFGYHTTLTGWEQQPSAAVGYSFKTMAVTLRGDLYITNAFYLHEDGYTLPFTDPLLNGFSVTTSLEQRLTKNKVMSVGLKWNYIRYHVLAWPAFPVNGYNYNVPEVHLGINF